MSERFMVDDAGTLIDLETRDTFDYVSDVVELLNQLHEENQELRKRNAKRKRKNKHHRTVIEELGAVIMGYKGVIKELKEENKELRAFQHNVFENMEKTMKGDVE